MIYKIHLENMSSSRVAMSEYCSWVGLPLVQLQQASLHPLLSLFTTGNYLPCWVFVPPFHLPQEVRHHNNVLMTKFYWRLSKVPSLYNCVKYTGSFQIRSRKRWIKSKFNLWTIPTCRKYDQWLVLIIIHVYNNAPFTYYCSVLSCIITNQNSSYLFSFVLSFKGTLLRIDQ